MGKPKLLLLDEPSLGLSPLLVQQIFGIIRRINQEQGVAILLVEQNAHIALKTADYGYVLEVGRIVAGGSLRDPAQPRRHQGILSRPEGSRRPRPAAVEKEAAMELSDPPSRAAEPTGRDLWVRNDLAEEASRHLERRSPGRTGAHVREIGQGLRAAGLAHGDVGCVLSETRPEFVYADLAILGCGGVSVAIDPAIERRASATSCARPACHVAVRRGRGTTRQVLLACAPLPGATADRHLRHEGSARLSRSALRQPGGIDRRRAATADWQRRRGIRRAGSAAAILLPRSGASAHVYPRRYHAADRERGGTLGVRPATNAWRCCRCADPTERVLGLYLALNTGCISNYLENPETATENLREVKPTVFGADAEAGSGLHARITDRSRRRDKLQKRLYRLGDQAAGWRSGGGLACWARSARTRA